MMAKFFAALFDKIDPVGSELRHAILRDILREVVDRSIVKTHLLIDVFEISFYGSSDHAKMPDNSSCLVLFKPLIDLHFGRLVFILKYSFWYAN